MRYQRLPGQSGIVYLELAARRRRLPSIRARRPTATQRQIWANRRLASGPSRLQADFDYRPANLFEGCPKHMLPMPGQRTGMRQNDLALRLPQWLTCQ